MASKGKKYSDMAKLIDKNASYPIQEAMELVCKTSPVKFDATVEIAFRLGVDPRQADQQIRGAVGLPNGTGKNPVVIVFAKGDKAKEAEAAGADFVGDSDLVNKIQQGWLEFDVAVATPDMMPEVGRLGKILGPRSLMPTPKVGTVTADVTKAITEIKAGKVEYRVDKAGNVHMLLGKVSFGPEKLMANFNTVYETILRAKPSTSKGIYIKNVALASTMGPGVRVATDSVTVKL